MRPDDANIVGNVHGGTILKMIEEAGCIIGTRHCNTQTGVSYAPMHISVIYTRLVFSSGHFHYLIFFFKKLTGFLVVFTMLFPQSNVHMA